VIGYFLESRGKLSIFFLKPTKGVATATIRSSQVWHMCRKLLIGVFTLPRLFVAIAMIFLRYLSHFNRRKYGICIASQWWGFYSDTLFLSLFPCLFVVIATIFSSEKSKPLFNMVTRGSFISSLFP
jgi:hypothetical protein